MGLKEIIKIGDKIRQLRVDKNLSQKEIADKLGIPRSTYANYENNNRLPNTESLNKICNFFNVKMDELIYSKYTPPVDVTIGGKIKLYREKKKITLNQLGETCGISKQTIFNYEKNKTIPSIDKLNKICQALNINIDSFLEEVHIENNKHSMVESREKSIILSYDDYENGIEKINNILKKMVVVL